MSLIVLKTLKNTQCDQPTDRRTDRVTYRVACTRLKICPTRLFRNLLNKSPDKSGRLSRPSTLKNSTTKCRLACKPSSLSKEAILNIEGLMSHEKHFFQTINHLCPILSRFLDASTHLYKRLCPSVGRSVGNHFFSNSEFG